MVRMVKLNNSEFSVYSIVGLENVKPKHNGITQDTYSAYDKFNHCLIEIVVIKESGRVFLDYGIDTIEIKDIYRN